MANCYLNKLYHLYHISIEDKRISNEEYDEFKKMVNQVNEYGNKMKMFGAAMATSEVSDMKLLEHIAVAEAKEE